MTSNSTTTSKPAYRQPRQRFAFRRMAILTLAGQSDADLLSLVRRAVGLGADSLLLRSATRVNTPESDLANKRRKLAGVRASFPTLWVSVEVQCPPANLPADGIHLKAATALRKPKGDIRLWTQSCHAPTDLRAAHAAGMDAVTYSPIFPTTSHPGAPAVGIHGLQTVAADSPLPVIALGGIWPNNASACFEAGAVAVAGIACFRDR